MPEVAVDQREVQDDGAAGVSRMLEDIHLLHFVTVDNIRVDGWKGQAIQTSPFLGE